MPQQQRERERNLTCSCTWIRIMNGPLPRLGKQVFKASFPRLWDFVKAGKVLERGELWGRPQRTQDYNAMTIMNGLFIWQLTLFYILELSTAGIKVDSQSLANSVSGSIPGIVDVLNFFLGLELIRMQNRTSIDIPGLNLKLFGNLFVVQLYAIMIAVRPLKEDEKLAASNALYNKGRPAACSTFTIFISHLSLLHYTITEKKLKIHSSLKWSICFLKSDNLWLYVLQLKNNNLIQEGYCTQELNYGTCNVKILQTRNHISNGISVVLNVSTDCKYRVLKRLEILSEPEVSLG